MGTLAVNYYLKALDNYPFDLKEALEALEYALSYDNEYADAHYLMGRLQMEYMLQMEEARYHFDCALVADVNNIPTYYAYLNWCILMEEYNRAKRLCEYAHTVKGINRTVLYYKEALIFEKQGDLSKAKKRLNRAIDKSISSCDVDYFKSERERVNAKLKSIKKKKNKGKTKPSKAKRKGKNKRKSKS
ncbi:MAG: tetratricopeptide (TPR) repeat protein [Crocinitomicaceae bacterium]|jgi:tetratricopeptide (TPR) repeat protein